MTGIKARLPDITIIRESHEENYLKEAQSRADSLWSRPPYVEHSEGCGRQGRGIYVPKSFLDSNPRNTNESSRHLAETFVNKWIDFRFGVFGYEASRSEHQRTEVFVNLSNETIDGVRSTSDQLLRSDQAVLCDGRTHEEVIAAHPDTAKGEQNMKTIRDQQKDFEFGTRRGQCSVFSFPTLDTLIEIATVLSGTHNLRPLL